MSGFRIPTVITLILDNSVQFLNVLYLTHDIFEKGLIRYSSSISKACLPNFPPFSLIYLYTSLFSQPEKLLNSIFTASKYTTQYSQCCATLLSVVPYFCIDNVCKEIANHIFTCPYVNHIFAHFSFTTPPPPHSHSG